MSSTPTNQPAANTVNHHTKSAGYRPDIDGLRALAVFAVFIFHAFPKALRGGFVGVDIFFVISGFLISSIIFSQLESGSFSFWNFYSRRIRRIYPVLITVLLACLVFGFCFPFINDFFQWSLYFLSNEFAQLGKHVAGGAGFISNFLLWFESGYFDNAAETKPLLHLWSLGIEEQFYIIWPLLLWLAWKKRFNLLVVSFVLAVISFGLNLYFYHVDPVADFFSPQTRFWELLCGAMLAWVSLHPAQLTLKPGLFFRDTAAGTTPDIYTRFSRYRHILSSAGFILLVASIVFIKQTSSRNYPGIWALFPVLATMLLIAAGKDGWFNKWVLSNKVLVWFGLISYPLYLWHWPLLSIARIVLTEEPPLWWRVTAFPIGILLAWLTTKCIENPLRFGKHGNIKTVALFAVMLLLGFAGLLSYNRDGFPSRFPATVSSLINVQRLRYETNEVYSYECNSSASNKPDYSSCRLKISNPSKPVMVIWGDSHATAIAHGILKYFDERYNIVLRQTSACPPVFDKSVQPRCKNNNHFIFQELADIKPQKVILAAFWTAPGYKDIYKKLETSIARLRTENIADIVVIGPLPLWKGQLPSLLASEYMKSGQLAKSLEPQDYERLRKIDRDLAALCQQWNISYISPVRLLCDKDGCLTMASDDPASVMTFDSNHLTGNGSDYLASQFKDDPAFRIKPH